MTFLAISFVAGLLTVLAPCILPLLPVVIGTSASGRKSTPYIIVASLSVSVILFTFLLKVSSVFIRVPPEFWTYVSGGIIFIFGLSLLFPSLWERIPGMARLSIGSNKLLGEGYKRKNFWGDVIIGASLGPIFSSCSPTYFIILASVLPVSFALGALYVFAYTLGLGLVLLAIGIIGEKFVGRILGLSDPNSKFKKIIGILFIILGLFIFFGFEKRLERSILESGFFDITKFENRLLRKLEFSSEDAGLSKDQTNNQVTSTSTEIKKLPIMPGRPYKEIVKPAGYVNTGGKAVKIGDYVGKKVILLDIMTYSCINCQRTFPYVTSWYEKYKDDGFVVIGIHTPEFAFEKDIENVEKAMRGFGINFPVVLDNEYGTWQAYGNRFWPRKYIIDIYGNIVYDHIGEGSYEEIEMKIRELLEERARVLNEKSNALDVSLSASEIVTTNIYSRSPETYFGSLRNALLGNGIKYLAGEQSLLVPTEISENTLYLGGVWNIKPEHAESIANSKVVYRYNAKEVYLVMSAEETVDVELYQDGQLVSAEGHEDVRSGIVKVKDSRLYKLIKNEAPGEHILELRVKGSGALFFAFTFG